VDPRPRPLPPKATDAPDWVRETVRVTRDEIRRFVATAAGFMLRPARFGAAWMAGESDALNPLGFVATALAVSGVATAVLAPGDDDSGLAALVARASLPYLYYAALGALCHPVLRAFGSTRPLRASVAVGLFAGGGPGLVLLLVSYACRAWRERFFGLHEGPIMRGDPLWADIAFSVLIGGAAIWFLVALVGGQRGVHAASRGRARLAVAFAIVASSVALGFVHRHVSFSMGAPHFALAFYRHVPVPEIWF
jgi:hypothetical protein